MNIKFSKNNFAQLISLSNDTLVHQHIIINALLRRCFDDYDYTELVELIKEEQYEYFG